jgi:hypothetical protein
LATRAGQSRSRSSTESPVAGARRRRDRHARTGQRLGFHRAPAGRRDGLIQTLTQFRQRSADRRLLHCGISGRPMSALGQKQQTSRPAWTLSALPPKADIRPARRRASHEAALHVPLASLPVTGRDSAPSRFRRRDFSVPRGTVRLTP